MLGKNIEEDFTETKQDIGVVLDEPSFPEYVTADQMNNIIRWWRVMIFRNGIRNRNGCLERLDGRAAGSSTTNRNFPGLRMMQKKDALEWSAESSAKMSRRQSIRSPRE